MGFLSEDRYLASLPFLDDEDSLETGEVGFLGNVRETKATQILVSGGRITYGEELAIEFGGWPRELDRELLGRHHAWNRNECHTEHASIESGDTLIVAEYPFASRQRYVHAKFRLGLVKEHKPHFGNAFVTQIRDARAQQRIDLVDLATRLLEDPSVVKRDPFNTGHKRFAGVLPAEPFGEQLGDYPRRRGQGEEGRTGWAFGTCRDPDEVHRRLQIELFERISTEAARQARAEGQPPDGRLRFAKAPPSAKTADLRLTGDVPDTADGFVLHAASLAMAGPGPGEEMPKDRSVGAVAFRRLNDLLFNLQKRVNRAGTKG